MDDITGVSSAWTDALMKQSDPEGGDLREHLLAVHRRDPGFTERCASRCLDASGQSSYEWLAGAARDHGGRRILDLACGSGLLLETCLSQCPDAEHLTGVDMSPDELAIAQSRLPSAKIELKQGLAQDLGFIDSHTQDAVLCHWALTLMEPLDPVLKEIGRVTKSSGIFAAIVDGDGAAAPGYQAIDDLIFEAVSRTIPGYGERDLGDPRVRNAESLAQLCKNAFDGASVTLEHSVFSLTGDAQTVAKEALGFYYAAFVLPEYEIEQLVGLIADFLSQGESSGIVKYNLPVCRLVVQMG